jgi:hypothetical protein
MVFRLYPDNAGDVRKDMAPVWSDLTLDGVVYCHPDPADQSDKKPFLIYNSNN